MAIWGIDLGGTKIEGVILSSLNDTTPIVRQRIPTEGEKGYDHIIGRIAQVLELLKTSSGLVPERIGICTPGVLDPGMQTMKNCNSTALNGRPLLADLERVLQIPVKMANDANCFALAETHLGVVKQQAPDAKTVFGIIMGTGVGGGIVVDGKIIEGHHGIGGEWGHNFLDISGGPCYCGKTGCVETVIAGPSLERYYAQQSGQKKLLKQMVADQHTDPYAGETLNRLYEQFGRALSVVINILDPDAIVIGGGVGNIEDLYTKGKERLASYIFNDRVEVPILKPQLGDSAGVFGAAALVG
ncbi:Sugar kinase of the NBD/HSP70 family, may contain an N-terminal HTH domain [Arachidicoccus rhizosphaerae]|uniref:Sugar kinase of the NBD/HSP70 family, may contain an N-terminal HTH domain n=1 Tax=Arachidicoccus rhizosphaerae TaxID=551991 RepID=A0A1H4BXR4_9BACT|nr:ROK family protein [Arachidicoccus rhizosphaerae]SEA52916.1 Sugar kinase of the NBD/HSP70 family, may contain an N-terminal HTH domain [Arachidicoccus rhizosphaerae]